MEEKYQNGSARTEMGHRFYRPFSGYGQVPGEFECGKVPSVYIKSNLFLTKRRNVNFSNINIFYRIVYFILSSPMRKFEEFLYLLVLILVTSVT